MDTSVADYTLTLASLLLVVAAAAWALLTGAR
jgi:hypothetical protein